MINTANYNSLYLNLQQLPEQIQIQVFDYVQQLVQKYSFVPRTNQINEPVSNDTPYRQFGKFKGKIKYPDDFNEPMEDFKEY